MWKQMKYVDMEETWCAGLIWINPDTGELGDGICACCGAILPIDELGETWKIKKINFNDWEDFTECII